MDRVKFIHHNNKKILLLDLAEATIEEGYDLIEEGRKVIDQAAQGSLLILTDITDALYDKPVAQKLREFANTNQPFVKASAVVGVTGLKKIFFQGIIRLTGRDMKVFETREQALDWLSNV